MRVLPLGAHGTVILFPHDIELQGRRIPARTTLWLHMFSAHNSSQYWEDPERFDPDRFLQPGAEYLQGDGQGAAGSLGGDQGDPRASGARPQRFFPFSMGERDCVGQNLGRLNFTATLAKLWGNFTFRLAAEVSPAGSAVPRLGLGPTVPLLIAWTPPSFPLQSAGPGGVQDVILFTLQPDNGVSMVAIPRVPLSA